MATDDTPTMTREELTSLAHLANRIRHDPPSNLAPEDVELLSRLSTVVTMAQRVNIPIHELPAMSQEEVLVNLAQIRQDREASDVERARIEAFESEVVQAARLWGMSWGDLALALGRSRPAVWQKHRNTSV
jgi:hypothetical protein